MLMNILIPLAAFAVSVTGASAFSPDLLRHAGLNEEQIAAFEEAKELRQSGDHEGARDVLLAANIDEEVMDQLREAMKEYKRDHSIAIQAAIEAGDYDSFRAAIADSPLSDIIDTEAEFRRFVEAHALIESGDKDEAKEIFNELGLNWGLGSHIKRHMGNEGRFHSFVNDLTDEDREELKEAMQSGDHELVRDILEEAGIDLKSKMKGFKEKHNR